MSSTLSTLDLTVTLLDSAPPMADLTEGDAMCEMRAATLFATRVTIVSADVNADLSGGARSAAR